MGLLDLGQGISLVDLDRYGLARDHIEHNKKAYKATDFPNATGNTTRPPEVFSKGK